MNTGLSNDGPAGTRYHSTLTPAPMIFPLGVGDKVVLNHDEQPWRPAYVTPRCPRGRITSRLLREIPSNKTSITQAIQATMAGGFLWPL